MNFSYFRLLFIFTLSISCTYAEASSVKIGQLPDYSDISVDSLTYQINSALGRARIDVVFMSDGFITENPGVPYGAPYDEEQLLVPGLSYDKTTTQVIYTSSQGTKTVCAELATKNGTVDDDSTVNPTGACSIVLSKETQTTDDGYNQTNETVSAVLFVTK